MKLLERVTHQADVIQQQNTLKIEEDLKWAERVLVSIIGFLTLLTIPIFLILFKRYFSDRLDSISKEMLTIAELDNILTRRIKTSTEDELIVISKGFNSFIENIRNLMLEIQASANNQ